MFLDAQYHLPTIRTHNKLSDWLLSVISLCVMLQCLCLPSCHLEWRPCAPSWSWAAASAPLLRICACVGRRFPVPGRWRARGRRGRARTWPEPGWSLDLWDWVCHVRGELREKDRDREERKPFRICLNMFINIIERKLQTRKEMFMLMRQKPIIILIIIITTKITA